MGRIESFFMLKVFFISNGWWISNNAGGLSLKIDYPLRNYGEDVVKQQDEVVLDEVIVVIASIFQKNIQQFVLL